MSQHSFFPTDKQLEEKPHLRAHLLQLKELQQQFFRDHPEEDHDEVCFFEVGQLGRPLVAEFRESFAASVAVPIRIAMYEKQMAVLQKLYDWFLKEYKTYIVFFFSSETKELVKRTGSYRNSAFWETSPASVTAASINNSSIAPTGFASTSASPVSDSLSLVDSYKTATEKRKYLQKYIRDEVLKLYQQRCPYEVKSVPWSLLLSSDSFIKLHPWTRVSGDMIDNRYRPQCLDLEVLKELASEGLVIKELEFVTKYWFFR
ncbi:hypothetical protein BD560DRAFT_441167 [Blakeslea trispora]|nr:hypothetical protein BD560DRAFT_441167 [Blakeslea trispora]